LECLIFALLDAEKLLFSLKEILVNESQSNSEIMLQVFWGLLSCEILNGKGRDVVEHTSLKKMKELIEKKFGQWDSLISAGSQEFTQTMCWMLHWLLIYSFTAKDLTNNGLFASILTDHQLYGTLFLDVIQLRASSLSRYMISSFLLARGQPKAKYQINKNALEEVALPIALENLQTGSGNDAFSAFLKAIYEDYDLEKALSLVEDMAKQAGDDFLLKNYVFDIKKQAYLLIFQTKCKVFRTVQASEIKKYLGAQTPVEAACQDIASHLQADGFELTVPPETKDGKGCITCSIGKKFDTE
jgi:translation initiation factor 3 subunit E